MTSRLVRGIAAGMGVAALVTAAFTQGVMTTQSSTIQPGTHATAYDAKPITVGLIPAPKPKPAPTAQNDATTLYDYINPCSLIPLDAIRKITGDYRLKFNSRHAGLTTNVAEAATGTVVNDAMMPDLCYLDETFGNVKPSTFIGVKTQDSTESYLKFRNSWNSGSLHAQDLNVSGLPSAREAAAVYITTEGQRVYSLLLVHTKYDQTLVIKWSGKNAVPVLRQLAYEALRTLTGQRYAGK